MANEAEGAQDEYAGTPSENKGNKALDSAISAAMTHSKDDEPTPEPEEQPSESEADPEAEGDAVEQDAAQPGSDQPDPDAGAEGDEKLGEDPSISKPPEHWNKEWQDTYTKLPDEAKRFARELDQTWARGFQQKTQELQNHSRYAQEVYGVIPEAVRQELQVSGQSDAQYVQNLAQWHAAFQQDPAATIRAMAEQARLTPDQVFQSQQGQDDASQEDDAWEDPELKQLRSELGETKQQLQAIQQNWDRMNQAQQQAYADQTIQSFRNATDEAGNRKYPYFDQVQPHMAALINNDPQLRQMPPSETKLKTAYERVMEPFQDKLQLAEQQQRKDAERKAHAEKVKAASTPTPRPGSSVPASEKPADLDSIIRNARSQAGL